jgi:hypothetical protein
MVKLKDFSETVKRQNGYSLANEIKKTTIVTES